MFVHVPVCTNFQALPWKSTVEVPWQVVPGPAAQSFCPLRAMPKHFSFFAATAASTSAFVSGPAAAIVASAVVTALARTSELTTFFADMDNSSSGLHRPQAKGPLSHSWREGSLLQFQPLTGW